MESGMLRGGIRLPEGPVDLREYMTVREAARAYGYNETGTAFRHALLAGDIEGIQVAPRRYLLNRASVAAYVQRPYARASSRPLHDPLRADYTTRPGRKPRKGRKSTKTQPRSSGVS